MLLDAQISSFGVYELTASKYEVLCGIQVSTTVSDPTLLGTFIYAPAAYRYTGKQ